MQVSQNSILREKIQVSGYEKLKIGDFCYIGPNANIHAEGGVEISDGTIIGPGVIVYSTNHEYKNEKTLPYSSDIVYKNVFIGKGCWIGESVMLSPGVSVGDGSVVAMGAVLFGKYPSGVLIMGNPAKVVKVIRNNTEIEIEILNKNFYLKGKK